ncbi:MAG: NmrA family NAD(P)-binding protein [Actinomycetota bacterium]|uniref:NmrA-like domain-containing protein n=1 Tax=marine metagenome TaxID=408172 RepID=A0A382G2N3_9ZZZZ|nr:NmrA family NAD(P)-binding protein [Actinomycetota bacterium]
MPTLAVTGAHGKTGQAVISACQGAWQIRALARNTEQANSLQSVGCEVVVGDMANSATLSELFEGVDSAYHICPNFHPREVEIGTRIADHAGTIERLVYHSVLHPQTQKMPHHWRKLLVEEILLEARSFKTTFVRSAPYIQNLKPYIDDACTHGRLVMPYSVDARTAMVDLFDVGRAVSVLLDQELETGSGWDLCGVGSISHREIAELLTNLLGDTVTAHEKQAPDGTPPEVQMMFSYMDTHGLEGSTQQLRALIGDPTPIERTLHALLAEIKGPST